MKFSSGFINLTPHEIALYKENGEVMRCGTSGLIARVKEETRKAEPIYNTPCVIKSYSEINGLPDPSPGTVFIVSIMVFERTGRKDVVCPDTGSGAVRDESGKLIGTKWFMRKQA